MAEGLLFMIGEQMLSKVISLAADEISLAWGFKDELQKLEKNFRMVNSLIYDASSNNKTKDRSVQEWLRGLNEVAYEADAVLDEYSYETLRRKIENPRKRDKVLLVLSVHKNSLLIRLRLAHMIKKVNLLLDESYRKGTQINLVRMEVPTTILRNERSEHPFIDKSNVVGRDVDVEEVVNMLCGSGYEGDDNLSVIAVTGIGGQGKTTLAKLVYKHDKVLKHFHKLIWITVSDSFDGTRLLKEMAESVTRGNCQLSNIETIVKEILSPALEMKRYLMVLDDVWNQDEEKWSNFVSALLAIKAASGSRILTTTCDSQVASTMKASRVYKLQRLSDEESWTIFKQRAFAQGGAEETEALVRIGKEIVKKCQGLPLAVKVIGSLMFTKEFVKDWLLVQNSQLWNLDDNTNRVLQSLKLSYDHLSFPLKRCLSVCSIYPKDMEILKVELIQSWMALGLLQPPLDSGLEMEDVGNKYFNTLLSCSLLEDARKDEVKVVTICKMHDIIHDLALATVQTDYSILNSQALVSSEVNSKLHLRVLVLDDYGMRELPNSINKLKNLRYLDISKSDICELPKSITKLYNLQALKINHLELERVPRDFANLINMRHLCVSRLTIGGYGKDSMSLKEMSRMLIIVTSLSVIECNGSEFQSSLGEVLGNSRSLREFHIQYCNEFLYLPSNLGTLVELKLMSCGGLKYIHALPFAKAIEINSCSKLIGLPSLTEAFPVLQKLGISYCDSMVEFPDMQSHMCLRELRISNLSKLTSVPNLCKSLQHLEIYTCGRLTSLTDKLSKALCFVEIRQCKDLVSLPSFRCWELTESDYEHENRDSEIL